MAGGGVAQATLLQKAARGRHKSLRLPETVALSAGVSRTKEVEELVEDGADALDTTTIEDTKEQSTEEPFKVPDQPFRLMDLPLEVRTMIFKELLVMPGPVLFKRFVVAEGNELLSRASPLAMVNQRPSEDGQYPSHKFRESNIIWQKSLVKIFLASKAIYRETVPLYFRNNVFNFDKLDFFESFVTRIGSECRRQLARLKLEFYGNASARAIKRLVDCVGLRELKLTIYSSSAAYHDRNASYAPVLYGMKDLLKVRGLTKLEFNFSYYYGPTWYPGHDLEKAKAAVIEQLQVLKQPHDLKRLKRQENKDFPARTTRRIVFGSANVVTRAEKRLLDAQQGAPSG